MRFRWGRRQVTSVAATLLLSASLSLLITHSQGKDRQYEYSHLLLVLLAEVSKACMSITMLILVRRGSTPNYSVLQDAHQWWREWVMCGNGELPPHTPPQLRSIAEGGANMMSASDSESDVELDEDAVEVEDERQVGVARTNPQPKGSPWKESRKYAIPALLFCIDNNLSFVVLTMLTPATYALVTQIKILFISLLFKVVFKKKFSLTQWIAVTLLCVGVLTTKASLLTLNCEHLSANGNKVAEAKSAAHTTTVGVLLLIFDCMLSAVADVYCEHSFKDHGDDESIHAQNAQLYAYGALFNAVGYAVLDRQREGGAWAGFNGRAGLVLLNLSCFGLATSALLKYCDNIVKLFVSVFATALTVLGSVAFFGHTMTLTHWCGFAVVICSLILYQAEEAKRIHKRPIKELV